MPGTALDIALADCNEALRLKPKNGSALESRCLVRVKMGEPMNAIEDFSAALKIDAKLSYALYLRGIAKRRAGAVKGGDVDITAAEAIDGDVVKTFAGYGVHR